MNCCTATGQCTRGLHCPSPAMRAPTPLPTVGDAQMDQRLFAVLLIAIWVASIGTSLGVIRFVWMHWDTLQTALWAWMASIS